MKFLCASAEELEEIAKQFSALLSKPLVLYLYGPLGAGKTTFVRGLLHALGWSGKVKSPTYTLMEIYELDDLAFYHFDLYRVEDAEELEYLGLREYLYNGILCFEWPEKAQGGLPAADISIDIQYHDVGRLLTISAAPALAQRIKSELSKTFASCE